MASESVRQDCLGYLHPNPGSTGGSGRCGGSRARLLPEQRSSSSHIQVAAVDDLANGAALVPELGSEFEGGRRPGCDGKPPRTGEAGAPAGGVVVGSAHRAAHESAAAAPARRAAAAYYSASRRPAFQRSVEEGAQRAGSGITPSQRPASRPSGKKRAPMSGPKERQEQMPRGA
jgi:hypothetical protein